jgi:thymidylate synthase
MMAIDADYAGLLCRLLAEGSRVQTRNSPVRRLFGVTLRFDSTPLVAARKTAWKTGLRELEFFLSGSSNLNDAHPSIRPWWRPWADEHGDIWAGYGEQLRRQTMVDPDTGFAGEFDQVAYLVEGVRHHPFSRRNAISTWYTPEMAHPDCPVTNCWWTTLQAFVEPSDASPGGAAGGGLKRLKRLKLHLVTYQRSADVMVGLPVNWLQAWAFLLWLAHHTGRGVGTLTWVGGDVHLYDRHEALARRVIDAAPGCPPTPHLVYRGTADRFRADDFTLNGPPYRPALTDRAEMVV